ncbi:prevent-host-death protein [Pedobacter sp. BS3]|uniref:prevent-host-death protein n=1 Tax=Pedobacter sp. BS3 TaxID=2567937 RepID=UPI0011EF3587|nr:prevent-host-death protein [Pedobacter sp. BS3]TZF82796.1 prevent-host-death protein [Pedobacter sp. BS3]
MAVLSFEIEESEVSKIRTILKVLGAKKLKIKEDETKMTKEEFYAKIDRSIKQAAEGRVTTIRNKSELKSFLDNL